MKKPAFTQEQFGTERIGRILLRLAPPVMFAQLIQALYNVVDSLFVGRYGASALTAVSVIYPLQLIIVAVAVGTGVGTNTYMARKYAQREPERADLAGGMGMVLAALSWAVLAVLTTAVMGPFVRRSATEPDAVRQAMANGHIVCIGSLGTFLESSWSKVHQARGNMRLPVAAQVAGALTNVVLDPLLIFGLGPFPELGVAGAAIATVAGQCLSAVIVGIPGYHRPPEPRRMGEFARQIYHYGYSSILMQSLYTVYIAALNMILAGFSDAAVTVLGLYYKAQSFFFIPMHGLQTCIVPLLSYNCARASYGRCRETMRDSILLSLGFMTVGFLCFVFLPGPFARLFSDSAEVIAIGKTALPIIGFSLYPAAFGLLTPIFFQAIGDGPKSAFLSTLRPIGVLLPSFWALSKIGLSWTWLAFPIAETVTGIVGMLLYRNQLQKWGALRART